MFKLIITTEKRLNQVLRDAIHEAYTLGYIHGEQKAYRVIDKGRVQREVDEILRKGV